MPWNVSSPSAHPEAGTVMMEGDSIQIWVSKGLEPKTTVIPSVIGLTLEKAIADLAACNLDNGEPIEVFDPTVPAGLVVYQYPSAATEVAEGTKVNLQVSKGPDPSIIPTPAPGAKEISITMPDMDGSVLVRIDVDGVTAYEESVDCTMDAVIAPEISGTGTQTVTIYFDGVLHETREVTFS